MPSDIEMIHKITLKLQETLSDINKMLAQHLKSQPKIESHEESKTSKPSKNDSKGEQKKEKTRKNSNEPKVEKLKRPGSAFILFSNEQRQSIQKNFPTMSITEISSNLGKIWGQLSAQQKKPYFERASKALEKFYEEHPEEKNKKRSKKNNK